MLTWFHWLPNHFLSGALTSCILGTHTGQRNKYTKMIVLKHSLKQPCQARGVKILAAKRRNCEVKKIVQTKLTESETIGGTFFPWPDIQSKWNTIGKWGSQVNSLIHKSVVLLALEYTYFIPVRLSMFRLSGSWDAHNTSFRYLCYFACSSNPWS